MRAVLRLGAIGCGFATALMMAPSALAYGALAIGEPADVAKDGLAMGWSADIETQEKASSEALGWCQHVTDPPVKAETRALCTVVLEFTHQCIGVAFDNAPHTPGRGWALGATKEEAAAAAIANCKATAGADRAPFCEIAVNDCDVKP